MTQVRKCPVHPGYTSETPRPPQWGCQWCWRIWNWRTKTANSVRDGRQLMHVDTVTPVPVTEQ